MPWSQNSVLVVFRGPKRVNKAGKIVLFRAVFCNRWDWIDLSLAGNAPPLQARPDGATYCIRMLVDDAA